MPHRTVADTGSFPVNPEGVAQWLAELDPLASEADAREVYRGLKHSNRLHNDVDQRRSVISCFIPVLRDLHRHLSELSNAQPLPLTTEFARNARLRDALLREEAFAFKILLSDCTTPLADDARRAMQALSRQATSVVHAYRTCPMALIEDAHQLYALAEEHKLLSAQQGSELLSLQDHYRFILLISLADLAQQRARQLPLILDFLKQAVSDVHIERLRSAESITDTDYAINLKQGSRPEPARSVLSQQPHDVRWFSVAPVLYRIDQLSDNIKSNTSSVLDIDTTLEHQSLARLRSALALTRKRRLARCISDDEQRVVFGHREVCAHLLYQPTRTPKDNTSGWRIINQTLYGMCLASQTCRAGLVQVGELVSVTDPELTLSADAGANSNKIEALTGVVRWLHAGRDNRVTVGVEFLARTVLPVHVSRQNPVLNSDRHAQDSQIEVGENAIIIACKIRNRVVQTIILPSFLYQAGDRLNAAQGGKSRNVVLHKCLQSNGLFSQYSLKDG